MLGLRAFREAIGESLELARRAESYVRASETLEMTGPAALGIVCFRFHPPTPCREARALEELNQAIQDRIVESGLAMMSSTRLRGEFSLRLAIMNYRSTWGDVLAVLRGVEEIGASLSEGEGP